jgi:hypothetical protein
MLNAITSRDDLTYALCTGHMKMRICILLGPSPVKLSYRNVGKWDSEANIMAPKKEPSRKVLDKHAKFLAAWEAAGFPDKFEKEGTSLNNVRSTADWYRQQKQKATKD